MVDKKWFESSEDRLREIEFYDHVAQEIEGGFRIDGLWAKALAESKGDEKVAKGRYIELRVQMLKDESNVAAEADSISKEKERQTKIYMDKIYKREKDEQEKSVKPTGQWYSGKSDSGKSSPDKVPLIMLVTTLMILVGAILAIVISD